QAIRAGASLPQPTDGASLLELCRELAYRTLAHCNFCPWNCRVDRMTGAKFGACKLASGSRVSSHFHHTGEELFYRGTQGSGTIFFTSCNMRCAFCQNGDISTDKDNGEETEPRHHWRRWPGRCAAKVATISIGLAVRLSFTCMPSSTPLRCWAAISCPRRQSSSEHAKQRPTASSGSTRCRAPPAMRISSMRRCCGTATSS